MAFAFPSSSPADDATFSWAGSQYIWRGDRWDSNGFIGVDSPLLDNVVTVASFPSSLGSQTNTTFFNVSPFQSGTGGIANTGEAFIGLRASGLGLSDGCPMILTADLFSAFGDDTRSFSGTNNNNMNIYFNTTRAGNKR